MAVNARISCIHALMFILADLAIAFGQTQDGRTYHGVCQVYNVTRCKSVFNLTQPRYVYEEIGFEQTELITVELGKQNDIIFKISTPERRKACKRILENVFCHFVFPPCSKDRAKLLWCREDCEHLFKICGDELNKLVGAAKVYLHGKPGAVIFDFNGCQDYKSVEESLEDGNESCTHVPFLSLPSKGKVRDGMANKILMIGVSAGVLFLLLLGSCLLYRCRVRSNRSHSVEYGDGKDNEAVKKACPISNIISMKDRIQEWKVAPSELVELVDICKSRGVEEIPVDTIEYLKDLGSGQYGLVFQGKLSKDIEGEPSRIVAVKTLREGSSHDAIKDFCHEVNIMSTFRHPHVVKLIGVSLAGEPYCMIFEFAEFGDLASFLRNCAEVKEDANSVYPKLTVTDQLAMATQVASGMEYISCMRCVHRDLAARNILVGRGLVVKISDFGLSRDVYVSEYYRMEKSQMLPVRWLPPEVFTDGTFTTYSDVYSYGVLLWELFTFAKLPYENYDNRRTMELILEGHILSQPKECPDPVYDIMKKCWQMPPDTRVLFLQIINELSLLDENGEVFKTIGGQPTENYEGLMIPQGSGQEAFKKHNSLNYCNPSFNMDEFPINVERLQDRTSLTTRDNERYSLPLSRNTDERRKTGDKSDHDDRYILPDTAGHGCPQDGQRVEAEAQDQQVSPQDIEVPRNPTEEVCDVPLTSQMSAQDSEGYDEEFQATYPVVSNVPPVSAHAEDVHKQPRQPYDILPAPLRRQRSQSSGDNDALEKARLVYAVPRIARENFSNELHHNTSPPQSEVYSVPHPSRPPRCHQETDRDTSNNTPAQDLSGGSESAYTNINLDGKPQTH